jgi:RNA polymerase sigma-70 factor (ECF subfamily)
VNNERAYPGVMSAASHSFDEVVVPHLDAGRRLARWRMGNEHDAEDVMQEASLRAFRYFHTFAGGNARAWFLRIVHNTCSAWRTRRVQRATDPFDEEHHSDDTAASSPEALFLRERDIRLMEEAISDLPTVVRDLLVLREFEGMSYRELADAFGIPMGTVMSRLSRARQALRDAMHSRRASLDAPVR